MWRAENVQLEGYVSLPTLVVSSVYRVPLLPLISMLLFASKALGLNDNCATSAQSHLNHAVLTLVYAVHREARRRRSLHGEEEMPQYVPLVLSSICVFCHIVSYPNMYCSHPSTSSFPPPPSIPFVFPLSFLSASTFLFHTPQVLSSASNWLSPPRGYFDGHALSPRYTTTAPRTLHPRTRSHRGAA